MKTVVAVISDTRAVVDVARPRRALPSGVALFMVVGALARVAVAASAWGRPPWPDTLEYVQRASDFSFLHPWAASMREPLWVALVKVVSGPFGYSPTALRVFGLVVSVGALVASWPLLRRCLPHRVAGAAFGLLAVHGALVVDAAHGTREPLVYLLFLAALSFTYRAPSVWWLAAVPAPALLVVRWEVGILALAVLAVATIVRRQSALVPALAVIAGAALAVPWLGSNSAHFGDPMYASNRQAIAFRNLELAHQEQPTWATWDGPNTTWARFYLDTVGPAESARRGLSGLGTIPVRLSGNTVGSYGEADQLVRIPATTAEMLVGAGVLMVALAGFVLSLRRQPAWAAIVLLMVMLLPYGPLTNLWFEYRVLSHALPLLAVLFGLGVEALSDPSARGPVRSRDGGLPDRP